MTLNSFEFLLFFIAVFALYFLPIIKNSARNQNVLLLVASYFFYGMMDWRMLALLIGVSVIFYFLGGALKAKISEGKSKSASTLTTLGVLLGIGILVYFKYLDFFASAIAGFLNSIGFKASWSTLNIIMPVGVSFFTFKLISYVIEIHREKIQPAENLLDFAVYISFFPTILSGPIDRPNTFLPQLKDARSFNYNKAVDGCQQILWGVFTKMAIADNIALLTGPVWEDFSWQNPGNLLMTILLSPVQVYADFDGYSNMAIGIGKILGFDITKNFDHPLLARNVSEYWRRWHISLTKWITDYVFMPLNIRFRDWGKAGLLLAITINLVVIGLWHGANWTYAVFGIYHSLLFIPLVLSGSFGKNKKLKEGFLGLPKLKDFLGIALTYLLIGIGHVIFFAKDVPSAFGYFSSLCRSTYDFSGILIVGKINLLITLSLFVLEWTSRKKEFAIQRKSGQYDHHLIKILALDIFIAMIIAMYGNHGWGEAGGFLYFKF